jgi:hypothetical protein
MRKTSPESKMLKIIIDYLVRRFGENEIVANWEDEYRQINVDYHNTGGYIQFVTWFNDNNKPVVKPVLRLVKENGTSLVWDSASVFDRYLLDSKPETKAIIERVAEKMFADIRDCIHEHERDYMAAQTLKDIRENGLFMTLTQAWTLMDDDRARAEVDVNNMIKSGWSVMSVQIIEDERYVHLTRKPDDVPGKGL